MREEDSGISLVIGLDIDQYGDATKRDVDSNSTLARDMTYREWLIGQIVMQKLLMPDDALYWSAADVVRLADELIEFINRREQPTK